MDRPRNLGFVSLLCVAVATMGACSRGSGTAKSGTIQIVVDSDMTIPRDIDHVSLQATQSGRTLLQLDQDVGPGALLIPTAFPIKATGDASPVTIKAVAFQAGQARVERSAVTPFPDGREGQVRLTLNYLCVGTAAAQADGSVISTCPTGTTCVQGSCRTTMVALASVPAVDAGAAPGAGGTAGPGTVTGTTTAMGCFDVQTCFAGATAVVVDSVSCSIALPAGIDPADVNVALQFPVGGSGVCGAAGCWVVFEQGADWTLAGTTLQLPAGVCAGAATRTGTVVVTLACAAKTDGQANCGPWSSITMPAPQPTTPSPVGQSCTGTSTELCGLCGLQTRTCTNGAWSAWAACGGEGACLPGETRACGTDSLQTCGSSCQWMECGCTGDRTLCASTCAPLQTDIHHCGSCGNDCALLPNVAIGTTGCTGGRCTYSCVPGSVDCAGSGQGCTPSATSVCGGGVGSGGGSVNPGGGRGGEAGNGNGDGNGGTSGGGTGGRSGGGGRAGGGGGGVGGGGVRGGGGSAASGTGGVAATGGIPATGGAPATGGSSTGGASTGGVGTGGRATGGVSGSGGAVSTGGAAGVCQSGDMRCSGAAAQTCSGGQWSTTATCASAATCSAGRCVCPSGDVCTSAGLTCADPSTVVICVPGAAGCFLPMPSYSCGGHQRCSGPTGAAMCACLVDPVCSAAGPACASSTSLTTCLQDGTCFYAGAASTCPDTNGDMSAVCERLAPTTCADSFWVQWPLPPSTTPTNYHDNGDGTVSDTLTGLMWQQVTSSDTMSWDAAKTYCSTTASTGGHNDWRLPSKIELLSIVDNASTNPIGAINAVFQMAPNAGNVWSSTPVAGAPSSAWSVDFGSGANGFKTTPTAQYVRCVR